MIWPKIPEFQVDRRTKEFERKTMHENPIMLSRKSVIAWMFAIKHNIDNAGMYSRKWNLFISTYRLFVGAFRTECRCMVKWWDSQGKPRFEKPSTSYIKKLIESVLMWPRSEQSWPYNIDRLKSEPRSEDWWSSLRSEGIIQIRWKSYVLKHSRWSK